MITKLEQLIELCEERIREAEVKANEIRHRKSRERWGHTGAFVIDEDAHVSERDKIKIVIETYSSQLGSLLEGFSYQENKLLIEAARLDRHGATLLGADRVILRGQAQALREVAPLVGRLERGFNDLWQKDTKTGIWQ